MQMIVETQTSSPSHHVGVSKNKGTPKSSILIGFSFINHPFWVPLFLDFVGNIHVYRSSLSERCRKTPDTWLCVSTQLAAEAEKME